MNFFINFRPIFIFMLKRALNVGLIFGIISVVISILSFMNPESREMVNLLTYPVIFGTVFLGMKWYKEKDNGGFLTYGEGMKVGVLSVAAAGVIVGAFTAIYISQNPEIVDDLIDMVIVEYQKSGMSDAQIEKFIPMTEMMFSPISMFISSIVSYALIGTIISLIVAAILKKEKPVFDELLD